LTAGIDGFNRTDQTLRFNQARGSIKSSSTVGFVTLRGWAGDPRAGALKKLVLRPGRFPTSAFYIFDDFFISLCGSHTISMKANGGHPTDYRHGS
jgi:hypothetical protein